MSEKIEHEHFLFEPIWQAIKKWDLERDTGEGYANATGTDVQTILNAIEPNLCAEIRRARLETLLDVTLLWNGRTFNDKTDWKLEYNRVAAIVNKRLGDVKAEGEQGNE